MRPGAPIRPPFSLLYVCVCVRARVCVWYEEACLCSAATVSANR
uniref:Uncharacterized protein n=1 Tax=Anopheles quadriannulatus TaxID=34691 RepID=A0A182XQD5_ANOQN